MTLIRDNLTSLYRQIAETLKAEIQAGIYEPSGKLPSETALEKRFSVSRVTVRLALKQLTEEGLVERKQGKGTYVSGRRVAHGLNVMRSFHESLKVQGLNASMRLLDKQKMATPPALQALFQEVPTLTRLDRLHLVDDEPIALAVNYFAIFDDTLSWDVIERHPTWTLLEKSAQMTIVRADIRLRLNAADAALAKTLAVKKGAPLFLLERTSWFNDRQCAEYSQFFIRPERYEFTWSQR